MVESRTARMRLVQWSSGTDSPQRVDFNETFLNIETLAAIDQQGTLSDRPSPSKMGMYYFATDQGTLYRSDGLSWAVVGASVLSQLVRPARTDAVAQTIQGLASQTADLQRVLASTGTLYQRVRSNGDLIHGPLCVSQAARTATATETVPTDSAVTLDNNSTGMWGLSLLNTTGNTMGFFRAVRGGTTVFSVSTTGVVTTPAVVLTSAPTATNHATTKTYVDTAIADRTYALTSDQLTGVLPVTKGGTGGTTEATARAGIGAAASAITISPGAGLTGGGNLTANRTLSVVFPASGSTRNGATVGTSDTASRFDHQHSLAGADIVGTLPVAQGGTNRTSATPGSYLRGNAAGDGYDVVTPANVRTDIDAATSGHGHSLTDANITGTLPVSQGGTGSTTVEAARTALGVPVNTTTITAGNGLTGGGNLTANRTISVNFAGSGSANTVARSDHKHAFSEILERLTAEQMPVATELLGGVNLDTILTDGDYTQTSSAEAASGTNYPTGVAGKLRVVTSSAGGMVWQKYTTYSPNEPTEYVRTRYSGTWGAWRRIADMNDIAALASVYAPLVHGHSLTDANITGTLPINQGGTGATTQAAARTALDVPSTSVAINAGAGLSGGGTLAASRTLQVVFEGNGSATTAARSDHGHSLTDANVTGVLPVAQGGTGGTTTVTARNGIEAAYSGRLISAGPGLTGGGSLTDDRTLSVDFAAGGTSTKVSRSDHTHALNGTGVTGTLPVARGGTGRLAMTTGSYLIGGSTVGMYTKDQVRGDLQVFRRERRIHRITPDTDVVAVDSSVTSWTTVPSSVQIVVPAWAISAIIRLDYQHLWMNGTPSSIGNQWTGVRVLLGSVATNKYNHNIVSVMNGSRFNLNAVDQIPVTSDMRGKTLELAPQMMANSPGNRPLVFADNSVVAIDIEFIEA